MSIRLAVPSERDFFYIILFIFIVCNAFYILLYKYNLSQPMAVNKQYNSPAPIYSEVSAGEWEYSKCIKPIGRVQY